MESYYYWYEVLWSMDSATDSRSVFEILSLNASTIGDLVVCMASWKRRAAFVDRVMRHCFVAEVLVVKVVHCLETAPISSWGYQLARFLVLEIQGKT